MSYAFKNWNEEVMKWLAVAMILAIALMTVIPVVSSIELAAYLASKGSGEGAAGAALAGAGLIRISPEVAMFLLEAGLISSSTGVGIAVGGIILGIGLVL